jgi:hypothetical protein
LIRNTKDETITITFVWIFEWHHSNKRINIQQSLGYGNYHFTVSIEKPLAGKVMAECGTLQGDPLRIKEFTFIPMCKANHNPEYLGYNGRKFAKYTKAQQDSMYKYLSRHGINDSLCRFLAAHSDERGFREDLRWNDSLWTFVNGPLS